MQAGEQNLNDKNFKNTSYYNLQEPFFILFLTDVEKILFVLFKLLWKRHSKYTLLAPWCKIPKSPKRHVFLYKHTFTQAVSPGCLVSAWEPRPAQTLLLERIIWHHLVLFYILTYINIYITCVCNRIPWIFWTLKYFLH